MVITRIVMWLSVRSISLERAQTGELSVLAEVRLSLLAAARSRPTVFLSLITDAWLLHCGQRASPRLESSTWSITTVQPAGRRLRDALERPFISRIFSTASASPGDVIIIIYFLAFRRLFCCVCAQNCSETAASSALKQSYKYLRER